jgi:flavin reductase (DIM6/NTAB) family NADH-FMN oxidoreductase RutF
MVIKMDKMQANISPCLQPMPKVLVSCRGADGKNNALAVAYCCNCSYDPPMLMVGIVPTRHSYKMIKETGCFVVNLVGEDQKEMFDYLGSHSGRDEDKLAKLGVKIVEGEKVNAPLLADCPINIECTVIDSIVTGSHEMFVGKIETIHSDKAIIKENGDINSSKIKFL